MVAVSVVLFRLVADSEHGKSDARLAQAQTSASGLYRDQEMRAADAGRRIGGSPELAAAIRDGDATRIDVQLALLARRTGAQRIDLQLAGGQLHTFGESEAVAASSTTLVDDQRTPAGTLKVSTETVDGFARDVRSVTGLETAVAGGGGTIASTLEGLDAT